MSKDKKDISNLVSELDKLKISVVGLGYVGLPTAVLFAEVGYYVIGTDLRKEVVEMVNRGESPLKDLDLDERLARVVNKKKLIATLDTTWATKESDVILIVVPTPTKDGDEPDLSYIERAGEDIAQGLSKGKLVVLESTVYPGVTEGVLKPILEKSGLKAGIDFDLAYCPERYNPGDPEHTIDKTKRIVSGINERSRKVVEYLYNKITSEGVVAVSNIRTAEAAKIIENTQRDLNIALMNEFALILEQLGLDVMEVLKAAETKWNFNKYYPGAGVGGHCLPKDPYYLVKTAEKHGYHAQIITAGRKINDGMPHHVFELLVTGLNKAKKPVNDSKVVVLGLSYKENIGDTRKSPSIKIIEELKRMDAKIVSVDKYVSKKVAEVEFGIEQRNHYSDVYEAIKDADALVVMVGHNEFRQLDLSKAKKLMNDNPVLIDGRRIYDIPKVKNAGFIYQGIGAGRDN